MAKTLIATATASSSSSLSFTSGIDSTYDVYEFHFINIHASDYAKIFTFQVNAAGQTGFNETMTSTFFYAYHQENGASSGLIYESGLDQAQGTQLQHLTTYLNNVSDEGASGVLTLYAPSSTTYVKHWTCRTNSVYPAPMQSDTSTAGYINTTSAIDEISFQMTSGNIDEGTIKMFGVS